MRPSVCSFIRLFNDSGCVVIKCDPRTHLQISVKPVSFLKLEDRQKIKTETPMRQIAQGVKALAVPSLTT